VGKTKQWCGNSYSNLGGRIVEEVLPEGERPEVSAIDGRMYKAEGPKWRESDRQNDLVPVGLRNVDTGPRHTAP
jgi:hypothetical protein